ncbi:uncharacterized protein LODBEIA_P17030 [Lodderomyces beijingensis]|uniref:Autophagy-related protein 11 n=1 Tax=Lodderomyces beijingensis TaxID=1775926 RepID=A0ABP0ZH41_9ASCO
MIATECTERRSFGINADVMQDQSNDKHRNNLTSQSKELIQQLEEYQTQARHEDQLLRQHETQINEILRMATLLQSGSPGSKQQVHNVYESMDQDGPLTPSIASITLLAVQLNKLKIHEKRRKVDSLTHARNQMQQAVDGLRGDITQKEKEIDSMRLKLLQKEAALLRDFDVETEHRIKQIRDFEMNKIRQVEIQALRLQSSNFRVLLEVSFHKQKQKLLFHHQPILVMEEFLGYNLSVINQFIERMIVFQKQFAQVCKINLPHLDMLSKFLPNTRFYDLLKKKELMITGGKEEEDNDDDDDDAGDENRGRNKGSAVGGARDAGDNKSSPAGMDDDDDNTSEKIVKLGNAYKLPLSSKTLNYQRRVARSNSIEPDELNQIPTIVREYSSTPSSSPSKPTSRKITIPHRIINKPFNKLSIKDFLEFLVIIVKVVMNFEVILRVFYNNNNNNNNNSEEKSINPEDSCSFEKLLTEISRLDTKYLVDINKSLSSQYAMHSQLHFQERLEQAYNLIINSAYAKQQHNKPVALQNLNFKNLFLNRTKSDVKDDWDLVSEML